MNYEQALDWLYSAQNRGIKLGLQTTRNLLDASGRPEKKLRFFHVAGTNGKGSVSAFLESILRAQGYRTGLYTSPHLVDFRERIRIDGRVVSKDVVHIGLIHLRNACEQHGWNATFFELTTVLALLIFASEGADIVVLETGMGGRLDSTNVVTPLACVITSIGLDHQQWLGKTLEEIAAEKAGIFKPGVPAVIAPQQPAVLHTLKNAATVIGCPLIFPEAPLSSDIPLGLNGSHQRWNARLAVEALHAAGIDVSESAVAHGLKSVCWPGRFQDVGNKTIIDGAHNPLAAEHLFQVWRETRGDKQARLIFGAMADKDYRKILSILAPMVQEAWLVPINSSRSADPNDLFRACKELNIPARILPSLAEALAIPVEDWTLITGSLYLAGEAIRLLRPKGCDFLGDVL